MGQFATVVIDPPWGMPPIGLTKAIRGRTVSNYQPNLPYDTMDVDQIAALPVESVLLDDAFVFCWTVNKFVADAISLMPRWGLEYSFLMSWIKSNGIQFPGSPMFNTEWCVVGRRGKARFLDTKAFATGNCWPWRKHSAKPEEFYDLLRRVTPGPRLDIFGRRRIAGFASWGNEAPDGPAESEHYQFPMLSSVGEIIENEEMPADVRS